MMRLCNSPFYYSVWFLWTSHCVIDRGKSKGFSFMNMNLCGRNLISMYDFPDLESGVNKSKNKTNKINILIFLLISIVAFLFYFPYSILLCLLSIILECIRLVLITHLSYNQIEKLSTKALDCILLILREESMLNIFRFNWYLNCLFLLIGIRDITSWGRIIVFDLNLRDNKIWHSWDDWI